MHGLTQKLVCLSRLNMKFLKSLSLSYHKGQIFFLVKYFFCLTQHIAPESWCQNSITATNIHELSRCLTTSRDSSVQSGALQNLTLGPKFTFNWQKCPYTHITDQKCFLAMANTLHCTKYICISHHFQHLPWGRWKMMPLVIIHCGIPQ